MSISALGSSGSGAQVTYQAVGLPPGLTYVDGVISGTISEEAEGTYTVTITATDPTTNGSVSCTFIWTVLPELPPG